MYVKYIGYLDDFKPKSVASDQEAYMAMGSNDDVHVYFNCVSRKLYLFLDRISEWYGRQFNYVQRSE
jgi:hypothetical protein